MIPGTENAGNNQIVKTKGQYLNGFKTCTLCSMQSKQHNSKTITDPPKIMGCSTPQKSIFTP